MILVWILYYYGDCQITIFQILILIPSAIVSWYATIRKNFFFFPFMYSVIYLSCKRMVSYFLNGL